MGYSNLIQLSRIRMNDVDTLKNVIADLPNDPDFTIQIMERMLQGLNEGQYLPYKTGALQNSAVVTPRQISYDTKRTNPEGRDYSQRVYHGSWMNFNTDINMNADAYWDKRFMQYEGDYFIQDIDEMVQERLNG